jgi:hypothetical protein
MLLNQDTLNDTKILSPSSVAEMTKDQIPYIDMVWNDGFSYGYGCALEAGEEAYLQTTTCMGRCLRFRLLCSA